MNLPNCPCRDRIRSITACLLSALLLGFTPSLQAASDRVVISPTPGFNIAWDGNNGGFSSPDAGAGPSNNVALASNGTVAIGSSEFGGGGAHLIANINDGLYGNPHSWISDFVAPDPDPWVGLNFGAEVDVNSIAWGRDNGDNTHAACAGVCTDRYVGLYTLQYTLVPAPDATTTQTDDPFTGWSTLGTIEYLPGPEGPNFTGYLRHRFDVDEFGGPIAATGVRIKVSDPGIAIDEIEVNPLPDPIPPISSVLEIAAETGFSIEWDGNEGNFSTPEDPAVVPANVAQEGAAFGSSELDFGVHFIPNAIDGLYGNANSWIPNFAAGDPDPFIGVNLGALTPITSIAWGRDNGNIPGDCCGGTLTDRALGVYTLQITLLTDADAATPDTGDAATGWQTIGTINYKADDPSLFNSHLRHRFDVNAEGNPIQAAAVRIKVPDQNSAIDEIEINPNQVIEQMLLATESVPGFNISWDGNEGQFFSGDAIAPAPPNRALVSEGTTPFSSSDLGPVLGIPFHVAANLNDGLYGNANSWISANGVGGTDDPDPFAGLSFGSSVLITNIAWGRDNGNTVADACGGTCVDRTFGTYRLQYTLVANPDGTTPDTADPFTGWADIGTVSIGAALPPEFLPWLRHRFEVSEFGGPIEATGIRIKVPDGSIAIDEIEVNTPTVESEPDLPIEIAAEPGFEIDWDGNEGNFSTPDDPALVPANAAQDGTAFGSSEFGGGGVHLIANINDGLYGNSHSWIANFTLPDPNPFIGVNLGRLTPVSSIAWGRDNGNDITDPCPVCTDRALGVYTLQFTTLTDADAATAETGDAATGWQTIGTVNLKRNDPILLNSHLRHRFDLSAGGNPIEAAAIRIKVSDPGIAMDEIEINPNQVIEQMLLVTENAPGFDISWDGNEGDFFNPMAGAAPPPNRALAAEGTIPFTSSDLGPVLGIPFHVAANINDGLYGNANSWISANGLGGTDDPDPFAGLNFGSAVLITNIAWSRDNGDDGEGSFTGRTPGSYRLQYTLTPDPDAATVETGDPFTGWADIGVVTYGPSMPPIFQGHLRHRFEVSEFGGPIEATGLRIKVSAGNIAMDEIEVNTAVEPPPPVLPIVVASEPGFAIGYDGNDGEFEDPAAGAGPPPNRGLASEGTVAFGSSELADFGHFIAEVNDGLYGNASSWISGPGLGTDPNPFIGLNFQGLAQITSIAWSRDNGDDIDNCCGGVVMDRSVDLYTLQYTMVPSPDASVTETGDPFTGWVTVGSVDIQGSLPPLFRSWVRHEFEISAEGAPLAATGIRIKVANNGTAIDEIEVNVVPNDPPVCEDGLAVTQEDQPVDITLSATDPEGTPVTFSLVDGPAQGAASLSGNTVAYTPAPNYNGPDSFTFVATDAGGASSEVCTVAITIAPVNDAPVCSDASAMTDEDIPVTISLPVSDVDGDDLTLVILNGPASGSLNVQGVSVTYQGNPNSCTDDSFTYQAVDPSGAASDVCTASISVNPVNDAPTAIVELGPLSDLGPSVPGNIVISPNNSTACVALDASSSIDVDAENGCGVRGVIEYLWMDAEGTVLGDGPVVEACLPVGTQEITLLLDDGQDISENIVLVDVLTGCGAVEELIMQVNDSVIARKNKRPFLATLKTACAAFDRGSVGSALNRLEKAFQNKVRAQVGKDNPQVAEEWIRVAREIIEAYTRDPSCEDCQ